MAANRETSPSGSQKPLSSEGLASRLRQRWRRWQPGGPFTGGPPASAVASAPPPALADPDWPADGANGANGAMGETPPARPGGGVWYAPLGASWADPARRPWLIVGLACLLGVLGIIAVGPRLAPQRIPAVSAPGAVEAPAGAPATDAPAAPSVAPPLGGALRQFAATEVALKILPFLLGLFWLLSAWLVDAEARRAFVVQEPWGERRTVAYSCLAVGCVFPLILAGLIFSAYGFVAFVIFIAARQSWVAGLQAGGLILVVGALALFLRGVLARYIAGRADRRAL